MARIHIDTEIMRQLGRRFVEVSEYSHNQLISELQSMTSQIEGDWQGISRQRYDELFQHWIQSAQSLLNWGQDIGRHLQTTAEQFDAADQS
ncbi:MAG: WXG100 family type VII secretion target [Ktedonobacteraceae bacterium]